MLLQSASHEQIILNFPSPLQILFVIITVLECWSVVKRKMSTFNQHKIFHNMIWSLYWILSPDLTDYWPEGYRTSKQESKYILLLLSDYQPLNKHQHFHHIPVQGFRKSGNFQIKNKLKLRYQLRVHIITSDLCFQVLCISSLCVSKNIL